MSPLNIIAMCLSSKYLSIKLSCCSCDWCLCWSDAMQTDPPSIIMHHLHTCQSLWISYLHSCKKTEGGSQQQRHRHRYEQWGDAVKPPRTWGERRRICGCVLLIKAVFFQSESSCKMTSTPVQPMTREGQPSISLPAMAMRALVGWWWECDDGVVRYYV